MKFFVCILQILICSLYLSSLYDAYNGELQRATYTLIWGFLLHWRAWVVIEYNKG